MGQSLSILGILALIIGFITMYFIGCERYITRPGCDVPVLPFYWIGIVIVLVGLLLFFIGWQVMKGEKVEKPSDV